MSAFLPIHHGLSNKNTWLAWEGNVWYLTQMQGSEGLFPCLSERTKNKSATKPIIFCTGLRISFFQFFETQRSEAKVRTGFPAGSLISPPASFLK